MRGRRASQRSALCYTYASTHTSMNRDKVHHIVNWTKVVLWVALIFHLSGEFYTAGRTYTAIAYWAARLLGHPLPGPTIDLLNLLIRKTAHFTEFFILGLLVYRALAGRLVRFQMTLACWVLGGGASVAMADEFRQIFVRERTPSPYDCLLDFGGVMAAMLWMLARTSASQAGGLAAWSRRLLRLRS